MIPPGKFSRSDDSRKKADYILAKAHFFDKIGNYTYKIESGIRKRRGNDKMNGASKILIAAAMLNLYAAVTVYGGENGNAFPETQEHCFAVLRNEKGNRINRRIAFRRLLYDPQTFRKAVEAGLKDADPGIRQLALYELYRADGKKALPVYIRMADDPSPQVRKVVDAVSLNLMYNGESNQLYELLSKRMGKSASGKGNAFSYFKVNTPISQDPTYDHEVVKLKTVKLPLKGWAFRPDPKNRGHIENWFGIKYNDTDWKRIAIGLCWERQGFPGYDGIAWYRVKFKMPEKMKCLAVELSFLGVDESAWVWLNGKYVGQRDSGPEGWKFPFKLDITPEVNWNAENLLVVRVKDTEQSGGIYKPVEIEIIK